MGLSGSDKAYLHALSGVARAGASRSNAFGTKLCLSIGGTQYVDGGATQCVLWGSLTITDILDEVPNTCAFTTWGVTPTVGQEVIVTLGSTNNLDRIFAGQILSVEQIYASVPAIPMWRAHAIDYTWLLNRRKVIAQYTASSASTIAAALISNYTSGFTSTHIASGLATVNEITFTNQDVSEALSNLARRIGAYWYIDYAKDLHFFTTETGFTNPTDLTAAHTSLSDVAYTSDLGQWITRVYVEGGGVNALAECAVGETIIPVDNATWYQVIGGTVVSGPQRLTYTGITAGGGGALVGPGTGPSAGPSLAFGAGVGLGDGVYTYAYTDVTAAGESLPSPLSQITTAVDGSPTTIGAPFDGGSGNLSAGVYKYKFTFQRTSDNLQTAPTPASAGVTLAAGHEAAITLADCSTPPAGYIRQWYRTIAGGSTYFLLPAGQRDTWWGEFGLYFLDMVADADLGPAVAPSINQISGEQVILTGIALGPAGTTQRKVYRTVVNGSQLKLQQTIDNNTATVGVQDATADGALGANAPTSDTSGLTQPDGQILAGATSLLVSGTGAFSASGGWAVIGNGRQVIRYTGITGNTLTGIPASGTGAITASISYNSTITAAPCLTGIPATGTGSILYVIKLGDPVNLFVQVDDFSGQTALAALIGGDGIQETYLQDRRLSYTECLARGQATLTLHGSTATSVTYKSRDINTKSGRSIVVNLAAPTSLTGTFKIQRVTISGFSPHEWPTYDVEASSTRYSFEDILRRLKG